MFTYSKVPFPLDHVRKVDERYGRKRQMREAARVLKDELAARFGNIYDAYSFFDIDGDWNLTVNEFLVVRVRWVWVSVWAWVWGCVCA